MMHKVRSSSIAAIGHDGKAMHVQFSTGETYRYPTASQKDAQALMQAPSIGKHFLAHIQNKHKGTKV